MPKLRIISEELYPVYMEVGQPWAGSIEIELTENELRQYRNADAKWYRAQAMLADKIRRATN